MSGLLLIIAFTLFPTLNAYMKSATPTLKPFLKGLEDQNKTLASWAREQGFALGEVYALTRGRTQGRRGQAREILIAMGITPPPMFAASRADAEAPRSRA